MSSRTPPRPLAQVGRFRWRTLAAILVVVVPLTGAGLFIAQNQVARETEEAMQRDFRAATAAIEAARDTRMTALSHRCFLLARKARIHAAFEDDALDVLYSNARDELRDLMPPAAPLPPSAPRDIPAVFYRFLDVHGQVISTDNPSDAGQLTDHELARLNLPRAPSAPQLGFLVRTDASPTEQSVEQFIATPIFSTSTGAPLAALVVGFTAPLTGLSPDGRTIGRGLWLDRRLQLPGLDEGVRSTLQTSLAPALSPPGPPLPPVVQIDIAGHPYRVLCRALNPASAYPVAFEVCLYPLADTLAHQAKLRWQILGLGSALLVIGIAASQFAATRLARPVEQLAAESAETVVQRDRAEAALESTQAELERAARFASDASHQLKTPIAVFRSGLEELLARDDLPAPVRDEISNLVIRTYRFTGMINDLLLLSLMEAGHLKIEFSRVSLDHLIASWLDDLSILPQALALDISTDLPRDCCISGEKRYVSIILQNLLENARKYNRTGGRIQIAARREGERVSLTIANTGHPIPAASQAQIFNRFHRGNTGENIPGHGLGLNLARELARLHGGDVRLVRSSDDWTEFEVTFRSAPDAVAA